MKEIIEVRKGISLVNYGSWFGIVKFVKQQNQVYATGSEKYVRKLWGESYRPWSK